MKRETIHHEYRFFPSPFIFKDNPLDSDSEIQELFLEGKWRRYALILFCCIKCWHITDQYFFPNIIKLGKRIEALTVEEELNYDKFLSLVYAHRLSIFGTVKEYITDHNFWYRIYSYIIGETSFHCKVEGSKNNLI